MSILKRVGRLVSTLHLRVNPALRWCTEISVIDAKTFLVDSKSCLRGSILCRQSSIVIAPHVLVAPGGSLNATNGSEIELRNGVRIGEDSIISVAGNYQIFIGENTTFFSRVLLSGAISIGADCLFGQNISVMSGMHIIADRRPIRIQDAEYLREHGCSPCKPVIIGDDCWIGANAVILPGVTLAKGCVVGAGAVVTKSFKEYSVVGGVPANLLKYR